jgi:hypothetical protein
MADMNWGDGQCLNYLSQATWGPGPRLSVAKLWMRWVGKQKEHLQFTDQPHRRPIRML